VEGVLCCNCPDCMEGRKLRKRVACVSPMADIGMLDSERAKLNRKQYPVASGVLAYFPDAIKAVAHCSYVGNEQHNPGTELHWDRSKSTDEADALLRHFMERGTVDSDGIRHSTKVAWRSLALLQKEIEAANEAMAQDAVPIRCGSVADCPGGWLDHDCLSTGSAESVNRVDTQRGSVVDAGELRRQMQCNSCRKNVTVADDLNCEPCWMRMAQRCKMVEQHRDELLQILQQAKSDNIEHGFLRGETWNSILDAISLHNG
jgi:hypothetical protein